MVKKLIKGTLLSILIFFSVSFLTVLFQINSPLNRFEERYDLRIGFPFEYYYEFIIDSNFNYGWNVENLIIDCFLIWGITLIIMMRNKK